MGTWPKSSSSSTALKKADTWRTAHVTMPAVNSMESISESGKKHFEQRRVDEGFFYKQLWNIHGASKNRDHINFYDKASNWSLEFCQTLHSRLARPLFVLALGFVMATTLVFRTFLAFFKP